MIDILNRKSILLTGILLLAVGGQTLWANDAAELHRTKCIACHVKMTGGDGGVLYKRDDGIVKNKLELKQRVAHCAHGAHTGWNDAEIAAVADYLDKLIYQFP